MDIYAYCCCFPVSKSCPTLETPRTIALHVSLSMGFSRPEYWSGMPCSPPGDFPDPGIEPVSLMSPAVAGEFFTTSITWEVPVTFHTCL